MHIDRLLRLKIEKYLDLSKSILLLGPRQVGKSTLIEEYLKKCDKKCIAYRLQEIKTYERFISSPGDIFAEAEELLNKGSLVLFIDEIQKIPKLMDGCQYLIDKYKKKVSVIITGSSARKLRRGDVNFLPGRVFINQLHPLIIPEIKEVEEQRIVPIKFNPSKRKKIKISLKDLLIYGSLPGVILEKDELKGELLYDYVSAYLQEEIRAEALARNIGLFAKFLEIAALESGSAPNLTNLSLESGVPVTTVKNYFYLLEDTLTLHSIMPFRKKSRKQILSTPRYILFDVGIRNAASKIGFHKEILKTDGGRLFEQFICLEFIKRIKYAYPSWKYYYWRTKNGIEVDFIIETDEEIIPIEIKYTDVPHKRHISHLQTFIEEFNCKRGFLVCTIDRAQKLTDKISAIPWHEI